MHPRQCTRANSTGNLIFRESWLAGPVASPSPLRPFLWNDIPGQPSTQLRRPVPGCAQAAQKTPEMKK